MNILKGTISRLCRTARLTRFGHFAMRPRVLIQPELARRVLVHNRAPGQNCMYSFRIYSS